MGQKVNPHGLRVGVIKDWSTRWYAKDKDFADLLIEDHAIRKYIKKTQFQAGISNIEIERYANRVKIHIHTAKPGMVIGKGGSGIEALREVILKMTGKNVFINIVEVKNVDVDAQLVAENIASQLERRVSFRRAMKQSISRAQRMGALGIKTCVAGRLNGAEMARTEQYSEGNVPLQTLRADIDYGFAEANTTYGKIGVKVWINKGEVLPEKKDSKKN
ncbi:MAG: 30S ribosomal protein S3 [Eubacteriales bacterium]